MARLTFVERCIYRRKNGTLVVIWAHGSRRANCPTLTEARRQRDALLDALPAQRKPGKTGSDTRWDCLVQLTNGSQIVRQYRAKTAGTARAAAAHRSDVTRVISAQLAA